MAKKKVADLLVDVLAEAGVRQIYGVSGDSLNGITDSIRRGERLRWIHVRHEETAAFAAGAEAHLTGRLAVCAGSCGPGNLHLINGLFDAQRSGVPVLAIAAHIPSSEIGIDYFQATHPESLFKECSHYVELVSNPAQLPQILTRAMRVAVGRRGVAVVVLPGDVAIKPVGATVPAWLVPSKPVVRPNDSEIDRLATLLNEGSRVTFFCGAGCAGAHSEVLALAKKLKAPIVHSLRGKEYVEYDNPHDVGMTGLVGFASGYHAMKDCDTLLILGADFPYRQFFPEGARIAQIATEHKLTRMATLTLDPAKITKGWTTDRYLRECWRKMRISLARRFGKSLPFVGVLEFHKSGVAHLHLLVGEYIPQWWLSDAWQGIGGGRIGQALSARPMRLLGELSYGIYLWHLPLLIAIMHGMHWQLFRGPFLSLYLLTAVSATAVAAVSWFGLERPLLRRFSRPWRGAIPAPSNATEVVQSS